MQTVKEYRQRSGHAINYYDGGAENRAPGSLAKDKMRNILGRADSKSNLSPKRRNTVSIENDIM